MSTTNTSADDPTRSSFFSTMAFFFAGLAVVVAFLALAINANRDGGSGGGSGSGSGTTVTSASGGTTVNVTLSDYKITLDQEKIPSGAVTFVVTNTSATPHNFAIPGLGKTKNLQKGRIRNDPNRIT